MKANLRQILITIFLVLVIFLGMQFSLQSYTVSGQSMEPSFVNGEWLLMDKLSYHFSSPKRGDVIIFQPPESSNEPYIKRIIGLPGENIEIYKGKIYIDGKELEETPDLPAIQYSSVVHSWEIPEGSYFVLGDNRTNSTDSRSFGLVPKKNIRGKVWIRYWPPSEWGLSPSYSTILE